MQLRSVVSELAQCALTRIPDRRLIKLYIVELARVIIGGNHVLADDTVADLQTYAQRPDVDDLRRDHHLDEASDSHAAGQAGTIRVVSDLDLVPRSPLSRHKVAAPVAAGDVLDTNPPGTQARPALQLLRAAIGALAASQPVKRPQSVRDPVVQRPHPVADSLDELRGPTSGSVRLPVTVGWGPARAYDVDDAHAAIRLCSRVLHEASTAQELVEYLNGPLLTRLWLSLNLPAGIVQQWEDRVPGAERTPVTHTGRVRLTSFSGAARSVPAVLGRHGFALGGGSIRESSREAPPYLGDTLKGRAL